MEATQGGGALLPNGGALLPAGGALLPAGEALRPTEETLYLRLVITDPQETRVAEEKVW